jgi:glycosyltransferase involved in cell wall biosynthesis
MSAEAAFWLAVLVLGYTWLGYPVLLALIAPFTAPPRRALTSRPRLSVIIAAYDEERWIGAKLTSTLAQHYPPDRLEVIVVSDGSTDRTDAIAAGCADPRVRLIRQEPRAGKSAALNRGVAAATGDVLVFTDANALFAPDALARLAASFADPRVGLVSGQGLYGTASGGDAPAVGNGYVRYEALVRRGESALGMLAGADGAVYALRRAIWEPLHPADVNDLLHPLQAALAGYQSRFDPNASTIEPPSPGGSGELRRHVRIIAQGIHLLQRWLPHLVAARRWRLVWALLSHRVLRWSSALFLATALVANVAILRPGGLYHLTLAVQLGFYGLALLGFLGERAGLRLGRLAIPYYFCVVSAAGIGGLARYLRRGAEAVWAPRGQTPARDRAA